MGAGNGVISFDLQRPLHGGAARRAVQEMLGPFSPATTQICTHVSIERLRSSYRQAHPRA